MSKRHKRIVSALDKGLSSDWNDDHIIDYTDELEHDFNLMTISEGTEWDLTETAAGVNPDVVFEDNHAWCKLNTGGVTGRTSVMKAKLDGAASNITNIADAPIHITAVKLEAYHIVGNVIEFGLLNNGVNIFTANQDGAYFRVKDNKLYAVTGDGAAETETEITIVSLGQDDFLNCRIELSATDCKFYVENTLVATHSNTENLPDSDLTIKYGIISANNVDSTMFVDGCGLTRFRKKS